MLTCEVGKDREGWVCYVVGEGEREKQVSVPDSLTLILRSLHGNHSTPCTLFDAPLSLRNGRVILGVS